MFTHGWTFLALYYNNSTSNNTNIFQYFKGEFSDGIKACYQVMGYVLLLYWAAHCNNTVCVTVCSTRCRRLKVASTPWIRSCAKTNANRSRERQRNPRWKWTCLIPITPRLFRRLHRRMWTVGRQCLGILDGDVARASDDETPTRITNIMDIESSSWQLSGGSMVNLVFVMFQHHRPVAFFCYDKLIEWVYTLQ